jgi:hypothetical protein
MEHVVNQMAAEAADYPTMLEQHYTGSRAAALASMGATEQIISSPHAAVLLPASASAAAAAVPSVPAANQPPAAAAAVTPIVGHEVPAAADESTAAAHPPAAAAQQQGSMVQQNKPSSSASAALSAAGHSNTAKETAAGPASTLETPEAAHVQPSSSVLNTSGAPVTPLGIVSQAGAALWGTGAERMDETRTKLCLCSGCAR